MADKDDEYKKKFMKEKKKKLLQQRMEYKKSNSDKYLSPEKKSSKMSYEFTDPHGVKAFQDSFEQQLDDEGTYYDMDKVGLTFGGKKTKKRNLNKRKKTQKKLKKKSKKAKKTQKSKKVKSKKAKYNKK